MLIQIAFLAFVAGFCSWSAVDGHWAAWSDWSLCDVTCGNGTMTRTRACSDPPPENGGDECPGETKLQKPCTRGLCPNHGGWSRWSQWGSCSVTCDVGLQKRYRACLSPFPARHCSGDARDDSLCFPGACSNGSWSTWGPWTACTRTCGSGVQTRSRNCDSPLPSMTGKYCDGDPTHAESCNISPCQGPVVFQTKHLSTLQQGNNTPMVFTKVETNVGNGYNTRTGIFKAPVTGTYSFNVQFCVTVRNVAFVGLLVNNVQKNSREGGGSNGIECRVFSYLASLKKWDKVQVKANPNSAYNESIFFEDRDRTNSFGGALLR